MVCLWSDCTIYLTWPITGIMGIIVLCTKGGKKGTAKWSCGVIVLRNAWAEVWPNSDEREKAAKMSKIWEM